MNPQTNYERIKNMSIEEMAEFLASVWSCDCCPAQKHCPSISTITGTQCIDSFTKWLESESAVFRLRRNYPV